MEDLEPLPPETWFERIEMIANGQLGSTESALRHALHMLQLTPREFRPREYGSIDEESYEALLPMLSTGRTLIYICGVAGMELGIIQELARMLPPEALEHYLHIDASAGPIEGWTRQMLHKQVGLTRKVLMEVYA